MADIANGIGSTAPAQLRTEQDQKNAELVKRFNTLLGDSPVEAAEKLLLTRAENERYLVENAVRDHRRSRMAREKRSITPHTCTPRGCATGCLGKRSGMPLMPLRAIR
jgi:hypothetical protein